MSQKKKYRYNPIKKERVHKKWGEDDDILPDDWTKEDKMDIFK